MLNQNKENTETIILNKEKIKIYNLTKILHLIMNSTNKYFNKV